VKGRRLNPLTNAAVVFWECKDSIGHITSQTIFVIYSSATQLILNPFAFIRYWNRLRAEIYPFINEKLTGFNT
jgi:hypothetical protein